MIPAVLQLGIPRPSSHITFGGLPTEAAGWEQGPFQDLPTDILGPGVGPAPSFSFHVACAQGLRFHKPVQFPKVLAGQTWGWQFFKFCQVRIL